MRRIVTTLSGVAVLGLLSTSLFGGATQGALFAGPVSAMTSPAPERSAEPHLTVASNGRILMSWLAPISIPAATAGQKPATGSALQFSELTGDRWSAPRTIVEGPRLVANWADFPTLFVTRNGVMAAHWLERTGQTRA